jgi:hypothetical protein
MNPLLGNEAIVSGSAGVSPAVFGVPPKTFRCENRRRSNLMETQQKQSAGYVFSAGMALPLPVRNERGEGRGEGDPTADTPTYPQARRPSSPQPSPPSAGGEGEETGALITFTGWPEYGDMLGGYFDGHPWGQFNAPLVVEDAKFPGLKNFPGTFSLFDEVYQIKDYSRQNVRVLMSLDASKLDLTRKGVKRTDKDFAVIWAKNFGKGRVLYNGLGQVPALWERPDFQKMWLEMVQWSMGLIPGDATPQPKPGK